jgi:hypothetical protein
MSSGFWVMVGLIFVCAIVTDGVVKIIKAAKSKSGSKIVGELEADLAALEQDVEDQRQRIEVLEKIVTDGKYDLGKQIDELAT